MRDTFGERACLAVELHRDRDDAQRLDELLALSTRLSLRAVASGDVHMATRRMRVLQDTMTAIRHGLTLAAAGAHLFRNGERHLRSRRALGNIHPHALLENAVNIARQCTFDLRKTRLRLSRRTGARRRNTRQPPACADDGGHAGALA